MLLACCGLGLCACAGEVRSQPAPARARPAPPPEVLDHATELPDPEGSWDAPPLLVEGVDADRDAAVPSPDGAVESLALTPPPLLNPIPLYDPRGDSLSAFYEALAGTQTQGTKTRIAFFGASHVASDLFTDVIRTRLQTRFGDGGPGFALTGKPWRWHRHGGVRYSKTRNFKGIRVRARAPEHGYYGLAGVALQSGRLRATSRILTRPNGGLSGAIDHVELYYLKRPRGGRFRVLIDGKHGRTISTRAPRVEPGYQTFELPLGIHGLEVRTLGDGPVRLFGAVLEQSGGGVVLDTLGIPGSRARNHLYWDEALYKAHLEHRNPDLFVLAYGTNEAGDDDVPIETYESRVANVIDRLHSILPHASCLLVGPSDRPIKEEDGTYSPRPRTAALVAAQARLAEAKGCAFFDLLAFMGGPMSMVRWAAADPPLGAPDHIHFTRAGYEALGAALHDAMLADLPDSDPAVAEAAHPSPPAPTELNALPDGRQTP